MQFCELQAKFQNLYGDNCSDLRAFHAPGRVNLIGDHTDYTGGLALPCAIDKGITVLIRPTQTNQMRFASDNFPGFFSINVEKALNRVQEEWVNYPLGVCKGFSKRTKLSGFDSLFYGDLPQESGLSSSAAIAMAMAVALNTILKTDFTLIDLVNIAKEAENNFVGVNCGILDQCAIAFSRKNQAIALNCLTQEHQLVPLKLGRYSLILTNSLKKRHLTASHYNIRTTECAQALNLLQKTASYQSLGELPISEKLDCLQNEEVLVRRVQHITTENERVRQSVRALISKDFQKFGQLMNESHDSLRNNYEVSCPELDLLVNSARNCSGVLGSRLTGAGFGGCTLSLVESNAYANFKTEVSKKFQKEMGYSPTFMVVYPSDGVSEIYEKE